MNSVSSYKVFARTYRPKTFNEVLGQEIAVQIFQNALRNNSLSHAIVLTGIRGVGKTTSARLLAKTLSCLNPIEYVDPCGVCNSCTAFDHEHHVDIIEMDAASHTGVDDIREIIDGVAYAPVYGRYRVYIIDEVHMLSKNAFNALLKTLEEPPAHAKFIFATTELDKVPETILSRCLQIQLRPMDVETILGQLEKICLNESLDFEIEGLKLIAEAAQGSMRDALSVLEKVASYTRSKEESITSSVVDRILGRPPQKELQRLCDVIKNGLVVDAITILRGLLAQDIAPLAIGKSLLKAVHHALCCTVGVNQDNNSFFKEVSIPQLNRLWSVVSQSITEILKSSLPKESCEVMVIRLCYVSDLPPLKQLIQSIEQKINSLDNSEGGAQTVVQPSISKFSVATDLTTFDKLVGWVDTQRDPHLSYFLKRDLRVHGFAQGYVECSLNNPKDQHLLKQLKELLYKHRKEVWVFEVVHPISAVPSTLHEQQQQREKDEKDQALQSELVQHALNVFPNADLNIEKSLIKVDA